MSRMKKEAIETWRTSSKVGNNKGEVENLRKLGAVWEDRQKLKSAKNEAE